MYGLVGVAPGTEQRIRAIKGRGEDKPFLQLLPESSWVARVSDLAAPAVLAKYWPGPSHWCFPPAEAAPWRCGSLTPFSSGNSSWPSAAALFHERESRRAAPHERDP